MGFRTPGGKAGLLGLIWPVRSGTYIARKYNTDVGIETAMKNGDHSSLITYNMYIPTGTLFKELQPETSKFY